MLSAKKITKTFLDLIKIDSPSGEEAEVAKYIADYLKNLGIIARRDEYGNLWARVPGTGAPLLLCAHMDTVEPGRGINPVIKGDMIRSDGRTILGADNKAAITAILEAAKELISKKKNEHRPLELIFTRQEETSMDGARNINVKALKAKEGLIMDKACDLGFIVTASPYIYDINIKIKGRAAHAGSMPEAGINAIQIASRAISELKIGRINKSTVMNVGVIQGGVETNVVPEWVEVRAETRSYDQSVAQAQVDIINKVFKRYVRRYKAKLYFKTTLICPGYRYSKNDKLIREIADLNRSLGYKNVLAASGGVSDANILNGRKLKIVNISYGGANVHNTKERLRISELVGLTEFLIKFCKKI